MEIDYAPVGLDPGLSLLLLPQLFIIYCVLRRQFSSNLNIPSPIPPKRPTLTGAMEDPRPVGLDEKTIQHQESNDLGRRHSHQELAGTDSSNEAELHESEKDIPVSITPLNQESGAY